MRPPGTSSTFEKRRKETVRRVKEEGWTVAEIMEKYKVTAPMVYRWLKAGSEGEGLDSKPNRGGLWRLDDNDFEKLEKLLLKGARDMGSTRLQGLSNAWQPFIEKWRWKVWPRLKKEKRLKATIVFSDESG